MIAITRSPHCVTVSLSGPPSSCQASLELLASLDCFYCILTVGTDLETFSIFRGKSVPSSVLRMCLIILLKTRDVE